MIEVKTKLTEVNKIFHVSDVHIRNFKRHEEYRRVFKNLRSYIEKNATDNSFIMITGDIVHSKNDVTPELVQEVQSFLKGLSEINEVVITAGNHDANLNNSHRLDTLSPIIEAINSDKIKYLKDSGVYSYANIKIAVWSVFENKASYPLAKDFKADYKIATFHGPVTSAQTDGGFALTQETISVEDFEGYDVVLLGDIHKTQFLNEEKTIAYPGSLIQQNHAEALDHGILVWDLPTKSAEFVKIPNDTAFFTVYLENGIHEDIPKNLPKKLYLRVKYKNTNQNELKDIVAKIKKNYDVVETSIQRINDVHNFSSETKRVSMFDTHEVDYQNKMILDYLKEKHKLDVDSIKQVCDINREMNLKLEKNERSRNILWIPKKFEFENMFSYGEGNVIDFENMEGTYGIFALNASGKSTLLDAITFCLFDKCSKTSKGSEVLNNKSNTFKCKLTMDLDGKEYVIERRALKQKSGNVRVEVDFYCADETGHVENLNGKERSDTNANIRNVFGTYDDFVLTTLSTQSNNTGFIDMNQRDRKELLSQFLDIKIFENLYELGNAEMKDVYAVLKEYQKKDHVAELNKHNEEIDRLEEQVMSLKKQQSTLESNLQLVNNGIIEESSRLYKIEEIEDLSEMEGKRDAIQENIVSLKNILEEHRQEEKKYTKDADDIKKKVSDVDINALLNDIASLRLKENLVNELKIKAKQYEIELKNKKDKLEKYGKLKFDLNCEYCKANTEILLEDETKETNTFQQCQDNLNLTLKSIEEISKEIDQLQDLRKIKSEYDSNMSKLVTIGSSLSSIQAQIHKVESKIKDNKQYIKELEKKIQTYHKREKQIESNKEVQSRINQLKARYEDLKKESDSTNSKIVNITANLKVTENMRDLSENSIKTLSDLDNKCKFYQYYLECVHRNGVPHIIVSSIIPRIEEEINTILDQVVDFKLMLNTDDKNIDAYIVYDEDNYWPIELTSGMEKFVSSLAIRTALIGISTLPRPNFMAIDEGFGALDQGNLGSMFIFFDYLKTQFKFVMIISHIDSMRDVVDKHLEINKIEGRSKIVQ